MTRMAAIAQDTPLAHCTAGLRVQEACTKGITGRPYLSVDKDSGIRLSNCLTLCVLINYADKQTPGLVRI